MRLIATVTKEIEAKEIGSLLDEASIEWKILPEEGSFKIWVCLEDHRDKAKEIYAQYQAGTLVPSKKPPLPEGEPSPREVKEESGDEQEELKPWRGRKFSGDEEWDGEAKEVDLDRDNIFSKVPLQPKRRMMAKPYSGICTTLSIVLCIFLFMLTIFQKNAMHEEAKESLTVFPPLQVELLYDFPPGLELFQEQQNQLIEQLRQEKDLVKQKEIEQAMIVSAENRPFWSGLYEVIVHPKEMKKYLAQPLFVDIKKGEIWRLFTPTFLHVNLVHILFNMLWLWMLGRMIEDNIGAFKLALFIVIVAPLTNTLQYLMTGPLFMGFSGVITAMAGYIWARKKVAPWEFYPIDRLSLGFLWIFVFGMFALQVVAFFLQILHIITFQLQMANTAHISGLLIGLCLARLNIFQRSK